MALTADTVLDNLGGTAVVSEALALSLSTVSSWRERGIPPRRWPELVRLATEKGRGDITFEALAESKPAAAETTA